MSSGKSTSETSIPKLGSGTGSVSYSHADFTYVRRKRRLPQEEETGELNIVPYLDILVNLIMFLLVTQATLVSLGLVDVTAPSYAQPGAGAGEAPKPGEEQLRLTIGIAKEGFFIAAKGGVLPGEVQPSGETTPDGVVREAPTVPKKADGSYDFPLLTAKLRAIKTAFPNATAVYVAADDNVSYEVLVKTLDASREDARGPLFPQVAFTQIN
ncbi:biopolymer transporter ExbD [Myxococcota bacterium]|nr:biopolymer transporter ExbD [Myxococcota bacterium]